MCNSAADERTCLVFVRWTRQGESQVAFNVIPHLIMFIDPPRHSTLIDTLIHICSNCKESRVRRCYSSSALSKCKQRVVSI